MQGPETRRKPTAEQAAAGLTSISLNRTRLYLQAGGSTCDDQGVMTQLAQACLHSVSNDLAEDCVALVQPVARAEGDEELKGAAGRDRPDQFDQSAAHDKTHLT